MNTLMKRYGVFALCVVTVLMLTSNTFAQKHKRDVALPSLSEPAWLVTEPTTESAQDTKQSMWKGWLAIPVLSLAAAATVVVLMRRSQLRTDRAEHAYLKLARKLRLSRRDRHTVEQLARMIKVKPVALLLSEHAFEVARLAAGKEHHEVDQTRQRLFL